MCGMPGKRPVDQLLSSIYLSNLCYRPEPCPHRTWSKRNGATTPFFLDHDGFAAARGRANYLHFHPPTLSPTSHILSGPAPQHPDPVCLEFTYPLLAELPHICPRHPMPTILPQRC